MWKFGKIDWQTWNTFSSFLKTEKKSIHDLRYFQETKSFIAKLNFMSPLQLSCQLDATIDKSKVNYSMLHKMCKSAYPMHFNCCIMSICFRGLYQSCCVLNKKKKMLCQTHFHLQLKASQPPTASCIIKTFLRLLIFHGYVFLYLRRAVILGRGLCDSVVSC